MAVLIEMLRLEKSLSSAAMVLAGSLAAVPESGFGIYLGFNVYAAMLSFFLIVGAGNVLNDCFDSEANRISKPSRPIPSGRISLVKAFIYSALLFISGVALSGFINYVCFAIAVIASLSLVLHSRFLQDRMASGGVALGYVTASSFLFGGAAAGSLSLPLWMFVSTFFSSSASKTIKGMMDIESDRRFALKRIIHGIARRIRKTKGRPAEDGGLRVIRTFTFVFLSLSVAVLPVPVVLGTAGISYSVVVAPAAILLAAAAIFSASRGRRRLARARRMVKRARVLVIVAFVVQALLGF